MDDDIWHYKPEHVLPRESGAASVYHDLTRESKMEMTCPPTLEMPDHLIFWLESVMAEPHPAGSGR